MRVTETLRSAVGVSVLVAAAVLGPGCGSEPRGESGPAAAKGSTPATTSTVPASPGMRRVLVYFPHADSCDVQAFPREVPAGDSLAVVRATLQALLAGPTAEEAARGFHSAIPDTLEVLRHRMRYMAFHYDAPHLGKRVEIQKLEPRPGRILYVSFSKELNAYDRGAVRVCAIIRQLQATVRQFAEWKDVMIAIDGETDGILQP
ncbi:MAG: GerMN domain-containing protein [bacterium]